MDINEIKKRIRNKSTKTSPSFFKKFLIKIMVLAVIFLITIILIKNDNIKEYISKNINKNISFSNIKSMYTKYLGSVLPFENILNNEQVFNEELSYKNISLYKDGVVLEVESNYLVPVKYSGIVVFIGEKENYGNTIIVEAHNVTIWYVNVNNSNVSLYDNVTKGSYLGEVNGNKLILLFEKDGGFVDYKEYL